MEFKELEYVNPLPEIAVELLGPQYSPAEASFLPEISPYRNIAVAAPALDEALSMYDPKYFDPSQYAHRVAIQYFRNVDFSKTDAVRGVSYAVAHAIVTDNELLQRHNQTSVRILLDLALRKTLTLFTNDKTRDELYAAHGIDGDAQYRLIQLEKRAAPFITAQKKLRERISKTPPGMRK